MDPDQHKINSIEVYNFNADLPSQSDADPESTTFDAKDLLKNNFQFINLKRRTSILRYILRGKYFSQAFENVSFQIRYLPTLRFDADPDPQDDADPEDCLITGTVPGCPVPPPA